MTSTLWVPADIERALVPLVTASHITQAMSITGVSIDSRTLKPGDLFFAIKGDNTDGHDYISQAFEQGAGLVVVAQSQAERLADQLANKPHVVVIDTLKAMELLGNEARMRSEATIIGITGSVGKTSTRHALGFLLSAQGKTNTSQKSYNNHWGVPLSLCNLEQDAAYGVYEMGMNASGEIRRLTLQVRPHVALITNIGQAHVGRLGSVEGIANAKSEIFAGVDRHRGIAILNEDTPCFDLQVKRAQEAHVPHLITFGTAPSASVHLLSHTVHDQGQYMKFQVFGKAYEVNLSFKGDHWISNVLGVFATLYGVGADLDQAAHDIATLMPVAGRGATCTVTLPGGGTCLLIDDSYNANPGSMAAGIAMLGQFPGRRIAVLGDMRELGENEKALHQELLPHLVKANVSHLFTCGALMHHLHSAAGATLKSHWAPDSAQLASDVLAQIAPGDVILVKGSLSMGMGHVVTLFKSLTAEKESQVC